MRMRLSPEQIQLIGQTVAELAGADASVRLFGSRLDDSARGGDIDLLLELPHPVEHPALLAAGVAARLERELGGRRVDVVVSAPNLQVLPIHRIARSTGRLL
jgi:predicted nucleotidyltransferase